MPLDSRILPLAESLIGAALAITLIGALCAALILVVVSLRAPRPIPLAVAGGILVAAVLACAIINRPVTSTGGVILATLATALSVIGGNPITRLILELAGGGRVRETPDGGILLRMADPGEEVLHERALLRGGTTIGYLERLTVTVAIIAGFAEAIAVVVAVKGIGRFSELAASEARERFIVGTLASLAWAGLAGGVVRLAAW